MNKKSFIFVISGLELSIIEFLLNMVEILKVFILLFNSQIQILLI